MKKIRTSFNVADDDYEIGEFYDLESEPSLTDPTQAMEIKDILRMFSRGGAVRVLRAQQFNEQIPEEMEELVQNLQNLDKTDRAQASIELRETINNKSESIDSTTKKIANAKIIAKAKAEAKAEAIAEAEKNKNPKDE